jgi:prevent-host-death family protein
MVEIHEASPQLAKLLEQVQRGESVVIAKGGVPVASLVPIPVEPRRLARPGAMKDAGWWIADDFDAPIDGLFDCLAGPLHPSA